ncbi:MAG: hypothetical protein II038_15570 [Lachnospiraceae bacterium]|nr:hypothetical protein [Lachnospiraceae bacterium]
MTRKERLYAYLKRQYEENEPIFLADLKVPDMQDAVVRQQLKKLTEDGLLKRFDTGIYFLPKKSIFRSGSAISVDDVIRQKYLMANGERCGYLGGLMFANQLGITTQVPMAYEVYTNKATTDYRETRIANLKVILRRPYVPVTDDNASELQFLDLMRDIVDITELEGQELADRLTEYMREKKVSFARLEQYFPYYPERIFKNMYEVGLLNGIST